jgi:hypothetical protein
LLLLNARSVAQLRVPADNAGMAKNRNAKPFALAPQMTNAIEKAKVEFKVPATKLMAIRQ